MEISETASSLIGNVAQPTSPGLTGAKNIPAVESLSSPINDSQKKKFTCQYCPKTFKRKNNLTTHVRFHTREHHFTCNECEYTCVTKTDLLRHTRTHSGEKPYT